MDKDAGTQGRNTMEERYEDSSQAKNVDEGIFICTNCGLQRSE